MKSLVQVEIFTVVLNISNLLRSIELKKQKKMRSLIRRHGEGSFVEGDFTLKSFVLLKQKINTNLYFTLVLLAGSQQEIHLVVSLHL